MKIISETLINVVHFAQSIVLVYHSISNINWGRFGDHFRVGDRFGLGSLRTLYSTLKQAIIAVLIKCIYCFHIKLQNVIRWCRWDGKGGYKCSLQYTTTPLSSAEASLYCGEAGENEKESARGTIGRGKREETPALSLFQSSPVRFLFFRLLLIL